MVTLKDIEALKHAYQHEEAYELEKEWHVQRAISFPHADRELYMRYIEELEAKLSVAISALRSNAVPAIGGKAQQYTAQRALQEIESYGRKEAT